MASRIIMVEVPRALRRQAVIPYRSVYVRDRCLNLNDVTAYRTNRSRNCRERCYVQHRLMAV